MAGLVDASGVEVTLPRAPRRIVSLIPSTTELLCRLGLADALVGVTVYCREPAAVVRSKTRVGGEKDPDLDRIRGLAPDLVIANVEENVREHVEALRRSGITVWVTYPRSIAGTLGMIRELGGLTGAGREAAALAGEIEPRLEEARAAAARRPPVTVFYPVWRDPYMTIGADTYAHEVLAVCGGANVFADRAERYPAVTLEEVAARRPAVILLPDEPFRFRRVHLADFAAFPEVPAVRDGRIHLVDGKLCTWHGPRLAEALRVLPPLLGAGSDAPRESVT
jgi:ABC-type Fe3+-hydroxamate transport system substrate-binding protein